MWCTWREGSLIGARQSEWHAVHWYSFPVDFTTKKTKQKTFQLTHRKGKIERKVARGEWPRTREKSCTPPSPMMNTLLHCSTLASCFQSFIFKALTFQAIIGYLLKYFLSVQ